MHPYAHMVNRYAELVERAQKTEAEKPIGIVDENGQPYRRKDIPERSTIMSVIMQVNKPPKRKSWFRRLFEKQKHNAQPA